MDVTLDLTGGREESGLRLTAMFRTDILCSWGSSEHTESRRPENKASNFVNTLSRGLFVKKTLQEIYTSNLPIIRIKISTGFRYDHFPATVYVEEVTQLSSYM